MVVEAILFGCGYAASGNMPSGQSIAFPMVGIFFRPAIFLPKDGCEQGGVRPAISMKIKAVVNRCRLARWLLNQSKE